MTIYECNFNDCNYSSNKLGNFKTHKITHTGEKPFKCNYEGCVYSCSRSEHLKIHQRTHTGEKPFKCNYEDCEYSCTTSGQIKAHQRTHTGEKLFHCDVEACEYSCSRSEHLKNHQRIHTGEKPFHCNFQACEYSCSRSENLKTHQRIHTGEKPFHCDFKNCKYSCITSGQLKTHQRTHTGEKPFHCDFQSCDYSCSGSGSLKTHQRTHTGEKPFHCDFKGCNFSCSRSGDIKKHHRFQHEKCLKCNTSNICKMFDKDNLCYHCGNYEYGTTPRKKRQDQVFQKIVKELEDRKEIRDILIDKQDPSLDSSTKHRGDCRIITDFRTVIIEVDESQHKNENYACEKKIISNIVTKEIERQSVQERVTDRNKRIKEKENSRMSEIASSGIITNIVFIRFNPDSWKDENGKIHNKKKNIPEDRLEILKKEIEKWLNIFQKQKHLAEVIYLFYDGKVRQTDFIPLDPSELPYDNNNINERPKKKQKFDKSEDILEFVFEK